MTRDQALRLMFEEEHFDGPPVGVFAEPDGSFPSGWLPMLRRRGRTILEGDQNDLLVFLRLLSEPVTDASEYSANIWRVGQWALGWELLRPEEARESIVIFVSDADNWKSFLQMCHEVGHPCAFEWIAMVLRAAAESERLTEELSNLALEAISFNVKEASLPTYKHEITNYIYDLTGSEDFVRG